MNFDHRALRRSNLLLATASYGSLSPCPDGVHPRYQWMWSEQLLTATPVLNSDGQPVMEYLCNCGIDKAVHSPTCLWSIASTKFMQCKIDPFLPNCFVLCTWKAPPSEAKWAELYGSFRYYPSEGRYVPLWFKTPDGHCRMETPFPQIPTEDFTRKMIAALRENQIKQQERMEAMDRHRMLQEVTKTRDYTPPANSKWTNIRNHLRDRMTTLGQPVGSKGSVLRFTAPAEALVGPPNPLAERLAPEANLPATVAKQSPPLIQLAK